jgi:hypothetical protein
MWRRGRDRDETSPPKFSASGRGALPRSRPYRASRGRKPIRRGRCAPVKTPADIIRKLHDDIVAALAYPQLKQRLADIATSVTPSTPAELAALLKSDMELWGPIIKASNIKGE